MTVENKGQHNFQVSQNLFPENFILLHRSMPKVISQKETESIWFLQSDNILIQCTP